MQPGIGCRGHSPHSPHPRPGSGPSLPAPLPLAALDLGKRLPPLAFPRTRPFRLGRPQTRLVRSVSSRTQLKELPGGTFPIAPYAVVRGPFPTPSPPPCHWMASSRKPGLSPCGYSIPRAWLGAWFTAGMNLPNG